MPNRARPPQSRKFTFNVLSRPLTALLLAASLAACGGGGGNNEVDVGGATGGGTSEGGTNGGDTNGGGTNGGGTGGGDTSGGGTGGGDSSGGGDSGGGDSVAGTAFTVEADRESTSPGGATVMLEANTDADVTIEWELASGSPGSVLRTGATTAEYRPPAADSAVDGGPVNIIASNGSTTETITLTLNAAAPTETGTEGAQPGTPQAPDQTPDADAGDGGTDGDGSNGSGETPAAVAPGVYLIAGNDFGAGMRDGVGTEARFNRPSGIVHDAQGNQFVVDRSNYVIRRIDAQGRVSVLAGMPGISEHADGSGMSARFSSPSGMAIDANGDLFVYDAGSIRRVTPAGNVTTLAGSPNVGGSQDGSGSEARFNVNPGALAFGPDGNLYIAERYRLRRMTPEGSVSTLAGHMEDGEFVGRRFVGLNGIAVDEDGVIYVTDGGFQILDRFSGRVIVSSAVYRIAPDGTVSLVAGTTTEGGDFAAQGYVDGNGADARFSNPHGIALDAEGNLFVADRGNNVIRRITPQGDVSTVAGTAGERGSRDGSVDSARFSVLTDIAIAPSGTLYVTDADAHTVRRIEPGAGVSTVAGAAPRSGSADGTESAALFNEPFGLTRDASGNLYVADTGNASIRRIAPDGSVTTLASRADGAGAAAGLSYPTDVAAADDGTVFVAEQLSRLILRIAPDGSVTTYAGGATTDTGYADGPAASAAFVEPRGLGLDEAGNLFVADRAGDAVRMITPQGMVSTLYGHQDSSAAPAGFGDPDLLFFPMDVAVDGDGNAYTVDSHSAVRRIAPDGTMVTLAGAPFAIGAEDGSGAQARFSSLRSVAVDQDGTIYVADGQRIRQITPAGVVSTVAGYGANVENAQLRGLARQPRGLVMLGPKRLGFLAGNGVFELRLP